MPAFHAHGSPGLPIHHHRIIHSFLPVKRLLLHANPLHTSCNIDLTTLLTYINKAERTFIPRLQDRVFEWQLRIPHRFSTPSLHTLTFSLMERFEAKCPRLLCFCIAKIVQVVNTNQSYSQGSRFRWMMLTYLVILLQTPGSMVMRHPLAGYG